MGFISGSPLVSGFGTGVTTGTDSGNLDPIELTILHQTPLVSVLIPCYNYAQYVGECIDSVLTQDYPEFEVIVSDDGSVDCSVEEAQRRASLDPRIVLIRGRHLGMAGALNTAWERSRGKIICLLDADDTFLPGKLRAVVDTFRSNPQVGYVIHRTCRTDAAGNRYGVMPLLKSPPSGWCAAQTLSSGGVLMDVPPSSNLSFRREVLEHIFPLPETLEGFAVLVIQRLAPLLTNILSLDQALATWRLHDANDTNSARIHSDRLERELKSIETVWGMQRRFLAGIEGAAASALQPLSSSEYYCRMRYILARKQGSPAAAEWRRHLLKTPGFRERPLLDRVLWRVAPAMPAGPMNRLLEFTITQNRAKEWMTRLLGIGK
jgi:hypothetical protein